MARTAVIVILISISAIIFFAILAFRRYMMDLKGRGRQERLARWFGHNQPFFLLLFMIIFLVCVIASTIHYSGKFLPPPSAEPAANTVPLFNTTAVITGSAFFLTQVLLFYFAFRFRTNSTRAASFLPENLKLELIWTIIPAISFLFLFLWGQKLWAGIIAAPGGDALQIEIVAEQFNWKARYPGEDGKLGRAGFRFITQTNKMGVDESDPGSRDDFVPVQMHIPRGRDIRLRLWSKDVIHSFFIPRFGTKMDALPGMITFTHFRATTTTAEMRERLKDPDFNYEVACAELCGRMHFAMKLILVVDEPGDFERWRLQQKGLALQHP